jgi:hypothetical protein
MQNKVLNGLVYEIC